MKLTAQLDIDVLALQTDEDVTCLLRLEAPLAADDASRPGESLVLVVDRSGSMGGEPLRAVRSALHGLVDRMKPQDTLGVVVFDHQAEILVPTRTLADHHKPTVHALIEGLKSRGTTDLSAGCLMGLDQARRHSGATGSLVLLLSDGHANAGIVDPAGLGSIAAQARDDGVSTGTIGIGAGYDETLLVELSTQGKGTHRFAYTPDDAEAVLGEEAGDLLSKSAINGFVRIRPNDPALVQGIGTLARVSKWVETDPDGAPVVVIPLGDMYSGETREVLVQFAIPGVASLGLQELATITFEYVALPSLESQSIAWPLSVNVLPGDEAAGRTSNPTVTTARLVAEVNQMKGEASDALRVGDTERAARMMDEEARRLGAAANAVPDNAEAAAELRARLRAEEEQARKLARGAREREAHLSRKSFEEDRHYGDLIRNDDRRLRDRRSKRDW